MSNKLELIKDFSTVSAFFSDGRGYVELTDDLIDKIENGVLVITEYQDSPLGEVVYLSGSATLN